jgi:Family of unknown function (DUF6152)
MRHLKLSRRAFGAGVAASALLASPSFAHHGWAWTEDQPFELTGVVEEIYIGNPHVALKLRAEDGVWEVDLAPLAASLRAGFDEGAAKVGDTVTCVGFRSRDHAERRMKAARVIVGDKTYDVYPNRVPSI